jgi:hypothetical protein
MTTNPTNPNRKSTAGSPKSTVDLRSEPLIWVEKRPANALSSGFRHSFCPITMRELWNAGQRQTEANKKENHADH